MPAVETGSGIAWSDAEGHKFWGKGIIGKTGKREALWKRGVCVEHTLHDGGRSKGLIATKNWGIWWCMTFGGRVGTRSGSKVGFKEVRVQAQ